MTLTATAAAIAVATTASPFAADPIGTVRPISDFLKGGLAPNYDELEEGAVVGTALEGYWNGDPNPLVVLFGSYTLASEAQAAGLDPKKVMSHVLYTGSDEVKPDAEYSNVAEAWVAAFGEDNVAGDDGRIATSQLKFRRVR